MPMTSRQRVLAALHHGEPDRVPVIIGVSNATGIKMRAYRWLKERLGIQAADEYFYDTQQILPHGTPQQVRDEVRRVIEIMAPGGGYMLAAVHTIMDEVPPENILAMVDAALEVGNSFCRARHH